MSLLVKGAVTRAATQGSPMHWSADRTLWDRKSNRVELFGHAVIRQPKELLTSDYALLDLNERTIDAKGNCLYTASDVVIHGTEMHFNMDTRTGTVVGGRVANDRFTLSGDRINKLSESKFQAHDASYSTCKDCPQSWTLKARDVNLEVEEYAYMDDVTFKVKDAAILWTPYLILPVKTKRQTGFLFPKFSFSEKGMDYMQPFFWATGQSTDMTISLGNVAGRGFRAEWEGRYQLTTRSGAIGKFFFQHDDSFVKLTDSRNQNEAAGVNTTPRRWAYTIKQLQELPWEIDEKLKFTDVSDALYTNEFVNDVPGYAEPAITSTFSLSKATDSMSVYASATRWRNQLFKDQFRFDPTTVQELPSVGIATNDKFLFGSPIAASTKVGLTNFTRSAGSFDRDQFTDPSLIPAGTGFRPGVDPLRKATRASVTPSLSTSMRPFGWFSVVPTAEYRAFFYNFPTSELRSQKEIPDLNRGYLLLRTDLSAQFERVYQTENPDIPRVKHLIRPLLTYSVIPYVNESYDGKGAGRPHPFLQQMQYANTNNFSGYNFDNYDIVPIDESKNYTNYFVPLGHSLSYGYTTQLVRRRGKADVPSASYQRAIEWRSGQTYNFRELKKSNPSERQPFSKLFSDLAFTYDQWSAGVNYEYFPYLPIDEFNNRNTFNGGFSYSFEHALHHDVLAFERSVSLGYSWRKTGAETNNANGKIIYSLSDYVMPNVSGSYNFVDSDQVKPKWLQVGAGVNFQSPSQCWRFNLDADRRTCVNPPTNVCLTFKLDLSLNLTGSGFNQLEQFQADNLEQNKSK